jgi:hypothetical protein
VFLKEKNISAARLISEVVMSRGNRRFLLTVLLHRNRGVTHKGEKQASA